ncbi:class I SAM-dependent methyltransferase [Mesorhizobium sp. M1273]|uniref:class I SAM-dependent methyltransferase n=1 Tax=Mesorhizobium sp. M1273 TaxID=2957075 RepID=UPI003337FDA1
MSQILCCPVHHIDIESEAGHFSCPRCGVVGRAVGPVLSFLSEKDNFYEGKYNNRTKYKPWDDGFLATLPLRIVLQGYPTEVAKFVPAGSTVVEIGCAGGIDWFASRYQMIGVDLSLTALHIAAENYDKVIQCNAMRLPIKSEAVDAVISSCLFEHLTDEDKDALLREANRVLKPGGKLVFFYDIETENPLILAYRKLQPKLYERLFLEGDGHLGYSDIQGNRVHFDRTGFDICREIFHERTPMLGNSVWQKFAQWPGRMGKVGLAAKLATSGIFRLPYLAVLSLTDTAIGRFFPARYARGMTTVAKKR